MVLVKAWNFVTDAVGWERFSRWAYRAVYWWLGGSSATSFNMGYAPLSPAVESDSSWQEPFSIELYRQVALEMGLERRPVDDARLDGRERPGECPVRHRGGNGG